MQTTTLPASWVQVVRSAGELQRVRWFQIRRYFEAGLIDELPTALPDDPLVAESVYFAAYAPTGEIWGTCRLIDAELAELPILRDHVIDPAYAALIHAERHQIAEVSRMAVASDAPQLHTVAALGRQMWRHCAQHQRGTIWLGSIGLPMMRLFDRGLGLPFEVMGPVLHDYYNEDSYPVLIDMVRFLLERVGTARWKFFTEDLVIDLTTMREPIVVEAVPPDVHMLRAC